MYSLYYWRDQPNFGDALAAKLLDWLGIGYKVTYARKSDLVVTGSVLEHLPAGWQGVVCGAGKLLAESVVAMPEAQLFAVRGPLTEKAVGQADVLGDPALLVADYVPRIEPEHEVGIVPHWRDETLAKKFKGHVIDVWGEPESVVRKIAKCKTIVSSSLHGLIVADAYSIPRRAEVAEVGLLGGDFKFRDYMALYDTGPQWGQTWTAPAAKVEAIRQGLREAFSAL